nr:plasmalemma vesicle-associated protein-like isoform X2 [Monopterus albus]XP_020458545.1 plasmalemma vesicle-associated protein-like isoform X2 [Monopterus albus]
MYSSRCSQAKFGLEARGHPHKPKGKSCGYYMRIVFFFSSLIQSLIIVSLVLFLIYGQPEKSAEEKRVKELQDNFNRLSDNNLKLKKEKTELGAQLGARTAEKAALEKALLRLKTDSNTTENDLKNKWADCKKSLSISTMTRRTYPQIPATTGSELKTLQTLNEKQRAMINLIGVNFTQTVHDLRQDRDNALRERERYHKDAIIQHREKTMLKEQLDTYARKCKEDFAHSLDGIKTVIGEFLNRINHLFPHQMTFHLTCGSQKEQMEKIRNSCTNLSRDVENKFQLYLDNVGNQVAKIQALSSRLEVQNSHLTADLKLCEHSRNVTAAEAARQLELNQKTHDDKVEKLLIEQNTLREQKKLLEQRLAEPQNLHLRLNAQSNFKPAVSKVAGPQPAPHQATPTVANWFSGNNKTPKVR